MVLTRERFTSRLTFVLVAPVTTRVRAIPTEVVLGTDDGLPGACARPRPAGLDLKPEAIAGPPGPLLPRVCGAGGAATFDNVFTLHRTRYRSRISRLADERLTQVCRAYRFAAGC
ncbi:MAG: hypothetical protein ACRD0U_19580 [Acidimicrobiales bacterium]